MRGFRADTSGATAIEYALLASLVAAVLVAAVTSMGTTVNHTLSSVATSLR